MGTITPYEILGVREDATGVLAGGLPTLTEMVIDKATGTISAAGPSPAPV